MSNRTKKNVSKMDPDEAAYLEKINRKPGKKTKLEDWENAETKQH